MNWIQECDFYSELLVSYYKKRKKPLWLIVKETPFGRTPQRFIFSGQLAVGSCQTVHIALQFIPEGGQVSNLLVQCFIFGKQGVVFLVGGVGPIGRSCQTQQQNDDQDGQSLSGIHGF